MIWQRTMNCKWRLCFYVTTDIDRATEQRERWEQHRRRRRDTSSASHQRRKRSFSTERYVETLIVVDPSMISYHKNEHLETYVLTIMNMVTMMAYVFDNQKSIFIYSINNAMRWSDNITSNINQNNSYIIVKNIIHHPADFTEHIINDNY